MTDGPRIDDAVRLRCGPRMPRIGFGTWPMNSVEARRAVATAIDLGYRLVDTAESYGNEQGVGAAIRAAGVPRDELFVTTKFNRRWHGEELVREALSASLDRLGLERVDLFLIHWPNPALDRYVAAWRGLIRLFEENRVRAIGTSNFKPAHLDRLWTETGQAPEVNQIQMNPFLPRDEDRRFAAERGIVVQSWSPLGRGAAELRDHPVVVDLARQYGRSQGEIILRWHLQSGVAVVVRSANPARMKANLGAADFALEPADLAALAGLRRADLHPVDSDVKGH